MNNNNDQDNEKNNNLDDLSNNIDNIEKKEHNVNNDEEDSTKNEDAKSNADNNDDDFFENEDENMEIEEIVIEKSDDSMISENLEMIRNNLINHLLSKYAVHKQCEIYIQDIVKQRVDKFLDFKAFVDKKYNNKYWSNPIINNFKQHKFNLFPWVIPIVLMKKKKYRDVIQDDDIVEESDIKLEADQKSVIVEERILENLKKDFNDGRIPFETYQTKVFEELYPYLVESELDENHTGYMIKLNSKTEMIPYLNFDTNKWNIIVGSGSETVETKILDEQKRVKGISKKDTVPADKVNIIGFVVLPYGTTDIDDLIGNNKLGRNTIIGNVHKIEIDVHVTITIPNHNISDGDELFLDDVKILHNINGSYTEYDILDKNRIKLHLTTQIKEHKTYEDKITKIGVLYKRTTLPLNVNQVIKSDDGFSVNSLHKSNKSDDTIADAYLAIDFKMNNNDMADMLNTILPNPDTIFDLILNENISNMNQLGKKMYKYGFTRNHLDKQKGAKIHDIMTNIETNSDKHMKNVKALYQKHIDAKKAKEIIVDETSIYSDKYILDSNIVQLYKLNEEQIKNFNSNQREQLFEFSLDKGLYYHLWVVDKLQSETNETDFNIIRTKLEQYKKKYITLQKQYTVENKKRNSDGECPKLKVNHIIDVFNEFDEDIKKFKNNEIVFEKSTHMLRKRINDEWMEMDEDIQYREIELMCLDKGINLTDKELSNLKCIYDNDEGECVPREWLRLKIEINKISKTIDMIEGLLESKDLKQKIIEAKQSLQIINTIKQLILKDNGELKQNSNISFDKTPIQKLVQRIYQTKSVKLRNYLLFKLIAVDGLLINNMIVSKKDGTDAMCGHWYYVWLIEGQEDPNKKNHLYEEMVDKFGKQMVDTELENDVDESIDFRDSGGVGEAAYHCKVCGWDMKNKEFDDVMGYDSEGHLIHQGEIMDTQLHNIIEQDTTADRMTDEELLNNFLMKFTMDNTTVLKRYLGIKGYSIEDVEKITKLQRTLNSFIEKMGLVYNMSKFEDFISLCMILASCKKAIEHSEL